MLGQSMLMMLLALCFADLTTREVCVISDVFQEEMSAKRLLALQAVRSEFE